MAAVLNGTVGVCWVLVSYAAECGLSAANAQEAAAARAFHREIAQALAWNVLKTARANPALPLCVLSSMRREAVVAALRNVPGFDAHADFVMSRLVMPTIPCAEPPATPARRGLADDRPPCPQQCAAAHASLPSPPPGAKKSLRHTILNAPAVRYSRLTKTRASAHVPFDATLILDADAALCPGATEAIQGVADELASRRKAVGVRYHGRPSRAAQADAALCSKACAAPAAARGVRARMRCEANCSAAAMLPVAAHGCCANTGVMLVRRSDAALELARAWHQRYVRQIAEPPREVRALYLGDQRAFCTAPTHAERERMCAHVLNLPLHLHAGKHEIAQRQRLHGRAVAVHGCKGHRPNPMHCAKYDACCAGSAQSCSARR